MRQAFAGLLWSKQFYHYVVRDWLERRSGAADAARASGSSGRNHEWTHLYNADVISMPDKWEYPWYAAWDLAFHCVPLALVDPEFAKEQLVLMLREWYMHPNGQLPAYEWAFGDVNPPVHAWAAWRVYKIEKKRTRHGRPRVPRARLPQAAAQFHLVGEPQGRRGHEHLPGRLPRPRQHRRLRSQRRRCRPAVTSSSPTARAGWRCTASTCWRSRWSSPTDNPAYEDVASKFWEHFLYIAAAMNNRGDDGDRPVGRGGRVLLRRAAPARRTSAVPLKVRSMVGLIPLFAVETLEPELLDRLPAFKRRMEWFIENRPDLTEHVACMRDAGDAASAGCCPSSSARPAATRAAASCSTRTSSCRRYGIRALSRLSRGRAVQRWSSTGTSIASTTSRPSRRPASSAATRTGAGRSGFRSTSC